MCGRHTLKTPKAEPDAHFGTDLPEIQRFNIAPSQLVPVIASGDVRICRSGFAPSW